jgi:LuxR family transcriptional regulator, quorum-sensing system regulator BjaR1
MRLYRSDSGIAGYEACVSLGGEHRDLNIRSKPAIHLVAMYASARRLLPCRFANV